MALERRARAAEGNLRELFLLFTKLGFVAFGGPAAHVAMMRDEVVTRRKWMGDQEFLDLNGATSLIPGPNSTELAIHIGRYRARDPAAARGGRDRLRHQERPKRLRRRRQRGVPGAYGWGDVAARARDGRRPVFGLDRGRRAGAAGAFQGEFVLARGRRRRGGPRRAGPGRGMMRREGSCSATARQRKG